MNTKKAIEQLNLECRHSMGLSMVRLAVERIIQAGDEPLPRELKIGGYQELLFRIQESNKRIGVIENKVGSNIYLQDLERRVSELEKDHNYYVNLFHGWQVENDRRLKELEPHKHNVPPDTCEWCGGNKWIRNPTGSCDHLYYPDNVNKNFKKEVKAEADEPKCGAYEVPMTERERAIYEHGKSYKRGGKPSPTPQNTVIPVLPKNWGKIKDENGNMIDFKTMLPTPQKAGSGECVHIWVTGRQLAPDLWEGICKLCGKSSEDKPQPTTPLAEDEILESLITRSIDNGYLRYLNSPDAEDSRETARRIVRLVRSHSDTSKVSK